MLALVLAVPGGAHALEDGWTHDVDLAAGFGSGTVTVALVGANIDVVGVGFGRTRPVSSGGVQTEACPPTLNLLALGRKDQGTLTSEFFVAWWFDERVALRTSTLFFLAVTFRP